MRESPAQRFPLRLHTHLVEVEVEEVHLERPFLASEGAEAGEGSKVRCLSMASAVEEEEEEPTVPSSSWVQVKVVLVEEAGWVRSVRYAQVVKAEQGEVQVQKEQHVPEVKEVQEEEKSARRASGVKAEGRALEVQQVQKAEKVAETLFSEVAKLEAQRWETLALQGSRASGFVSLVAEVVSSCRLRALEELVEAPFSLFLQQLVQSRLRFLAIAVHSL